MSGSGHHRRLGTPATTVKAQLRSRWSGGPDHGHPGTVAEEKPPCCETFPLDTGTREDDTPEALKRFLHQIAPEPDPEPDPVHDHLFQRHLNRGHLMDRIKMADSSPSAKTSRRSSLAETGSQKGEESEDAPSPVTPQQQQQQHHKFTEMEIVTLWNRFKFDFPTGNINEKQLHQLFRQVFPRCNNPEGIVDNILMVFDPENSGIVSFRELLILFSMSMDGTPREKLHWAFRLYDQDGDDLLNEEDMIDVFKRLFKLASNMDAAQKKGKRKKPEKIVEEPIPQPPPQPSPNNQASKNDSKQKPTKAGPKKKVWKAQQSLPEGKLDIPIMSSKMSGRSVAVGPSRGRKIVKAKKVENEPAPPTPRTPSPAKEEEINDDKEDPVERALDIFHSLDVDSDGVVTEEEFVEGCLTDPNFLAVLETFNCDFIWNT